MLPDNFTNHIGIGKEEMVYVLNCLHSIEVWNPSDFVALDSSTDLQELFAVASRKGI